MAEDIQGVDELLGALRALPAQGRACAVRGLQRSVLLVHRDAIRNAPRSPSSSQVFALRKTLRDTSGRFLPRATSRPKPGGLERSIEWAVDEEALSASVFVASNAEAGEYAEKMHDERGETWQDLGPGSIAKGGRVGDKFIERSMTENEPRIRAILTEELQRGLSL